MFCFRFFAHILNDEEICRCAEVVGELEITKEFFGIRKDSVETNTSDSWTVVHNYPPKSQNLESKSKFSDDEKSGSPNEDWFVVQRNSTSDYCG